MNWKEQFDEQFSEDKFREKGWIYDDFETVKRFISTEIIGKLIEDIPNVCDEHPNCIEGTKKLLRNKWL